jgi:hypothetical protein
MEAPAIIVGDFNRLFSKTMFIAPNRPLSSTLLLGVLLITGSLIIGFLAVINKP